MKAYHPTRAGWGRRAFMQGSAAAMAAAYGLAPRYGLAADVPLQYRRIEIQAFGAGTECKTRRRAALRDHQPAAAF